MFAAELVEVVNAQSGKGLAIKAGFSRENNGPGDNTLISLSVPLRHSLACMTDASMHMQCATCFLLKFWAEASPARSAKAVDNQIILQADISVCVIVCAVFLLQLANGTQQSLDGFMLQFNKNTHGLAPTSQVCSPIVRLAATIIGSFVHGIRVEM